MPSKPHSAQLANRAKHATTTSATNNIVKAKSPGKPGDFFEHLLASSRTIVF
jgi:hypothetical protein